MLHEEQTFGFQLKWIYQIEGPFSNPTSRYSCWNF